ncbi:hypothetical protein CesoFtcFv8_000481 [Champsocephalus esox]|uniref:Uncharacterized protein n=1 Tax=Champsocephalus esox TaxID=159716 RepID=A0AAN8DBS6_9TELE|nr:hypothetical protein CesoFtcFv8_000481 [Champsocephalus esox]
MQLLSAPKHRLVLSCDLRQGEVAMGVRPSLPVPGVAVILGNDLAGGRVWPDVPLSSVVSSKPVRGELADPEKKLTKVVPACAVTRAQTYKAQDNKVISENIVLALPVVPLSVSRSELAKKQQEDPTLPELLSQVHASSPVPLRKVMSKECGVQVNVKVDKTVQCSLGPKTLFCSEGVPLSKSPKSPGLVKAEGKAPYCTTPVSHMRFLRPVSIYSPAV